jgi:hypothetical protein
MKFIPVEVFLEAAYQNNSRLQNYPTATPFLDSTLSISFFKRLG